MERPMLRLPPLTAGNALCRLPISDVSAAALVSALLEDESESAERLLRCEATLRSDPPFTIWCALHPGRKNRPQDFAELAKWLDANLLAVLRWNDCESGFSEAEEARCRHTERAARGLALAEAAEALVAPGELAGRARLLAFLSQAYEWLVSGANPRQRDVLEHLAPSWLRRLMPDLRHAAPSNDSALQAVKRAIQSAPVASRESAAAWSHAIPWAAAALPRLTDRLARLKALETDFETALRREKLAALQKLAYGASHEINNPLANIATRAQTLLKDERDPERQRALATINDQAFRAFEMIANMMLFAKPPELSLAPVNLPDVARVVVEEMRTAAQQQGTSLSVDVEGDLPAIFADATQMAVLLRALLRNALEAVECGGEVDVAVRHGDQDCVQLAVRDSGPGLSDEARRHLFDPFYSSREAGRGLGFGLSWCWTIVEQHQGRIDFECAPGKGTTFLVTLAVDGTPEDCGQ
jgi:signal transduction histidine kinase